MNKHKIIYISPFTSSSFVQNDLEFLSKYYKVVPITHTWHKNYLIPLNLILQFLSILNKIGNTKAIIISSGGYWSFMPALLGKILKKRVFIVLNGADCVSIPEISYGSLRKSFLRLVCKFSYQLAYKLLPVSESLVYTKNTYYRRGEIMRQGYKYHLKKVNTPFEVISNGFDINQWFYDKQFEKKPRTFLTALSKSQFKLKGADLIIKISDQFPNCTFFIAGIKRSDIDFNTSPNVKFLGCLTALELRKYYSLSAFYLQLSISEGFGCALCEAMLCECIPIGSNVNAIPDIIGDSGFILKYRSADILKQLITSIFKEENISGLGKKARQRVINNYSLKEREESFTRLIEG